MERIPQNKEQNKKPYEKLKEQLGVIAKNINRDLSEKWGIENFLDDSGTIEMEQFAHVPGFDADILRKEMDIVQNLELQFSGAHEISVQEFYKKEHGITDPKKIAAKHKEQKERGKSGQMEMLATALFYKAFGDNFFVARASVFDDYVHGIDTVLINKKTGEIVCAFDEVHNHIQSKRKDEKLEKIRKIARKGGTTFRYGIALDRGVFARKSVSHLPVFCVSLGTEELEHALTELGPLEGPLGEHERKLCGGFVSSMLEQSRILMSDSLQEGVSENITRTTRALEAMQNMLY